MGSGAIMVIEDSSVEIIGGVMADSEAAIGGSLFATASNITLQNTTIRNLKARIGGAFTLRDHASLFGD